MVGVLLSPAPATRIPAGEPARTRSVLVVIPAWNEEGSVGSVVEEVRAALPGVDVVVVDDGSTDGTRAAALGAGALVLSLPLNLGVGGAMRTGYRYAVRHGYDVVVQVDADGQHDPGQVPQLLAAVAAGADVVVGARFAGTGDYAVRGPRRWAMRLLAVWLTRIVHAPLTDVTSGFRAVGGRAVALFARHYPAEYLGDTVQTLVIAARAGCRVVQVPVAMRARTQGTPSQSPWRAALYLLRAILAVLLATGRTWPATTEPEAPVRGAGGGRGRTGEGTHLGGSAP